MGILWAHTGAIGCIGLTLNSPLGVRSSGEVHVSLTQGCPLLEEGFHCRLNPASLLYKVAEWKTELLPPFIPQFDPQWHGPGAA